MLREVVADEHVEQIGVPAEVRHSQGDQLAVPGHGGVGGGSAEVFRFSGQQGGGYEQRWRSGLSGTLEDFGRCVGVATDQAVEKGGVVVWHTQTVNLDADGALTMH